ncbi:hypothetical protein R69746_05994 [Paraburkholderia aspalathi]|uniref:hypothetical protein n=1 Tax=Paraburkholderia aspalathi TaxID=1324617 RepID=UPI00190D40FD|nr:hypothetical protein [Paraburkholderia aspalathi]MBK3842060.1 hypothetical protein [Paraburkholderia aspalathi]CAE6819602.1 hypothetical protein R69746_05994 [Paraburkholderia aspalathi]
MSGQLHARRVAALPPGLPNPPRTGAGGHPRVLTELMHRLGRYLDAPDEWLPSLNRSNGSTRQQRTERSVACMQLLRASLKYLDLLTLRVGIPSTDGSMQNLTLPFLADQAGLDQRRAERAMHDLQRAGLTSVRRRCERINDGNYRGLAAIKYLPPALFGAFGLAKWLRHERSKAALRQQMRAAADVKQRRRDARDERERARGQLWLAGLKNGAAERADRSRAAPSGASRGMAVDAEAEFERQIQIRASQIKQADPSLDHETCFRLARQQLAPPRS